ncbi:hypothetical protein ACROYT_G003330 [Oculina patagonica]
MPHSFMASIFDIFSRNLFKHLIASRRKKKFARNPLLSAVSKQSFKGRLNPSDDLTSEKTQENTTETTSYEGMFEKLNNKQKRQGVSGVRRKEKANNKVCQSSVNL